MTIAKLNYDSKPEAILAAIEALPELSRKAYDAIEEGLYAEPYFSDLEWSEVAKAAGITTKQISGVAAKLIETGLVYDEEIEGNLKIEHRGQGYNISDVFVHALAHDLSVGTFAEESQA